MAYILKDKFEFLSEASKILSSSLDYNVTLASIAKLIVNNVADFCMIDIIEKNQMSRVAVRVTNQKDRKLAQKMFSFPPDPRNKKAIFDTARTGRPILIRKATKGWLKTVSRIQEERDIVSKLKLTSYIFTPLISRGKVIGVITIGSNKEMFSYNQDDVAFMKELASRAGLAVDNARLFSEAQEALRTRDEFLSIASHELRTPLTSILLNIQLILFRIRKSSSDQIKIEDIVEMLERSEQQSYRLSRLINDLLNISVISTGRLEIEKEPTDLVEVVKGAIARHDAQFNKLGIKLIFKGLKKLPGNWDKVRLEQVVSNLITNAMKYGKRKPITIEIDKSKNWAILKVKDRGIGIDRGDLPNIFEKFKRVATNKGISGLGVGLYISHQIVEAHGGKITVKSNKKIGTTFTVFLPL